MEPMGIRLENGIDYLAYLQELVRQINEGAIPNLDDNYTYMTRLKCKEALDEAKKALHLIVDEEITLPCTDNHIN